MSRPLAAALLGLALAIPGAGHAGPPYVTDDPEPTDLHHWEVYAYVDGAHVQGSTAGETGLDINYGGARDLQLTLTLPAAYDTSDGGRLGMGVVEAAAKYRLVHADPHGWRPDVAVFPRVFLPTASRRFASTRVDLLLPVWAQKDVGPWSVFGGGGYQINPGPGRRNFWISGLVVARQLGERLNLGAEVFHHTRDAVDSQAYTGVNLGVVYKLQDHWALMASGGPGIQNARTGGRYDFYLSLQAAY